MSMILGVVDQALLKKTAKVKALPLTSGECCAAFHGNITSQPLWNDGTPLPKS